MLSWHDLSWAAFPCLRPHLFLFPVAFLRAPNPATEAEEEEQQGLLDASTARNPETSLLEAAEGEGL